MGTGLLQPTHLIFLLVLALLLFGAKRLPEIGRSLGVGMREFKDSVTGIQDATKIETRSELPPPAACAAHRLLPRRSPGRTLRGTPLRRAAAVSRQTEPVSVSGLREG